ncbi:saccharopine dehydrogenase [Frigidibacter sp. ROC022]|uniref:saccharopine dehydrogenase n=1 Tax=Frigidibacter sp. ROC022 TaxID=2971796 RepID=UPI00215A699D|nr:saccharopine dehydrogenase [Frigidibacter sp. ROC022]MCR8724847.1 saccharopine dehydrogenase [Frigidibacter sp. ROC022]
MTHIWMRTESRENEARAPLTPEGAAQLLAAGIAVTVEESRQRALPLAAYRDAGCAVAPEGSWPEAPAGAFVLGLKELPEDGSPLRHRHIMFGHAFKGQPAGRVLLERFRAGGGTLLDLEYLVDETGRRVAAFGYWAGFAGAAVTLLDWAAQARGGRCGPVGAYASAEAMVAAVKAEMEGLAPNPRALVIGALGRVGTGATDFCGRVGVPVTGWDMAETAGGGPFPEVLEHELFFNCILARPGCPVFVPAEAVNAPRALRVIGDIACDPTSDFSPVKVYDRSTTWEEPVLRVAESPVLDVMAIDNLPSMLPAESSQDFAAQLLPSLLVLDAPDETVWTRAEATFRKHL